MKIHTHRAEDRGGADHGWLKTRYSFSFADWYDPARMGFGALRVINDDWIAPATGFGKHGHKDMEIITIVTGGAVSHEDSLGTKGTVLSGEVQVMSAGTGVVHAEMNNGADPLTLFQLWITPKERGVAPAYAQAAFDATAPESVLVSPYGYPEGLSIHQDAFITRLHLEEGETSTYTLHAEGAGVYVLVVEGVVSVGEESLGRRDAAAIIETSSVVLQATSEATLFVIEVPLS